MTGLHEQFVQLTVQARRCQLLPVGRQGVGKGAHGLKQLVGSEMESAGGHGRKAMNGWPLLAAET